MIIYANYFLIQKHIETKFAYKDFFLSFLFCNFASKILYSSMNRLFRLKFSTIIVLLISACTNNPIVDRLEYIKRIGNEEPKLAIAMLDSLELNIRSENESVRNKYDLLRIRVSDKALIPATSDILITKLVKYFEEEGTVDEKQEVYYYAGSIYRDLQDTPRALENFFRSIDYAQLNEGCDSTMLRNAYSNLCFLMFRVQNYNDAIIMAKKEQELSKKLGDDDIVSYMHIGAAYKALDSLELSINAYDDALNMLSKESDKSPYQEDAIRLFYDYSLLKDISKAKICKGYIDERQSEDLSVLKDMAYGSFYEACAICDSAILCFNRVVDNCTDIDNRYDAARHLYNIYSETGDLSKVHLYAGMYMHLSDSLDFGKRQELAATVNNAYKYHLDEKREQSLKDDREKYRGFLVLSLLSFVAITAIIGLFYLKNRNAHLKKIIELSSELERLSVNDRQLRKEIEDRLIELETSEDLLIKSSNELNQLKLELEKVNSEVVEYDFALKEKEKQLSEKIEQNKLFIKLLHQSELEGKAEDVIHAIRQSSVGKKTMTLPDWKQLYQAVDELYPNFKDQLIKELGTFTEQHMQVCYLMRIGLSKPQIQNMTNLSRVTVWRWVKKYDWVLTSNDK